MRSVIVLAFFAVLLGYASAQFCHTCEVMINDVQANHPDGFDNVSDAQLTAEMDAECDKQMASMASLCKQVVQSKEKDLMAALRAGKSAHDCCVQGGLC